MDTVLVELAPNRLLLDSKFDGYKLSLQELPIKRRNTTKPVDRVLLNRSQYSLVHTKLYGLHNHLVGDLYDEHDSVYFVDSEWCVRKVYIDPFSNELIDPVEVWQVPKVRERTTGDFNVSVKFVGHHTAILGDGMGTMYILETGDKNNDDIFRTSFSEKVVDQDAPFIITDGVLKDDRQSNQELHVLLQSIEESDKGKFLTILHWVTLINKGGKWEQLSTKKIKVESPVQYAALERSCDSVYVVSGTGCSFVSDSNCTNTTVDTDIQNDHEWTQDNESISIKVRLPENADKTLICIKSESTFVEIEYDSTRLVSGQLYLKIDPELTTWAIQGNMLAVSLNKKDESEWPTLFLSEHNNESVCQPVEAKFVCLEDLPPTDTTFNENFEECDLEDDTSTTFERLTNRVTHKVNLGLHQVLLTASLSKDLAPALGIRHDVDVCLWQPQGRSDDFSLIHMDTLLAFGYVQASKRNRKFSVCPPDVSYSAICESSGHVFIYRQKQPIVSGELRNRNTGKHVHNTAEQQVVNLLNNEILGAYPFNSTLFLLCGAEIIALKL